MALAVLAAVLAVAALAVWLWGLNPVKRWQLRHLPGPRPVWLMGNMRQMEFGKSHVTLHRWVGQHGPVFKYFLGRRACVVLSDPELVRQVAVKRFMHFHDRPRVALRNAAPEDTLLTENGILFAEGKYWLGIRTACEPLFHSTALAAYAPMMNAAADQLVHKLQAVADSGAAVDVSSLLKEMSLDVIGITAFGVDFRAQKEGNKSLLVEAAETMFEPAGGYPLWAVFLSFSAPSLRPLLYKILLRFGKGSVRHTVAARRYLWGASQALLDSARKHDDSGTSGTASDAADKARCGARPSQEAEQEREADQQAPLDERLEEAVKPAAASAPFLQAYDKFATRVPPPSSIVSRLKHAVNKQTGEALTDLDICAQLFTFLLAGYETTSIALSFTLYELARHPAAQRRIQQELDALGPADQPIAYEDLPKLAYTEAAFLEGMRLYPPVSPLLALARVPKGGGTSLILPAGAGGDGSGPTSIRLPEDTRVQLNVWSIHRDPKIYPEPEQYRPERFLPDSPEAAARHPGAYFPFGLGPRKCVGYRFAQEEGVLCLARLLRRFDLRLDTDHHTGPLDLRSSVTVSPVGGIWLRVHPRGRK